MQWLVVVTAWRKEATGTSSKVRLERTATVETVLTSLHELSNSACQKLLYRHWDGQGVQVAMTVTVEPLTPLLSQMGCSTCP